MRWIVVVGLMLGCGGEREVVEKWSADWEALRACLLGSPVYGPDMDTAYQVSELREGVAHSRCRQERRRALVPLGADAERASPSLRDAQATLYRHGVRGRDIGTVDEYVAKARKEAGLPAIARAAPRTLRLLETSIDLGTEGVDVEPDRVRFVRNDRSVEIDAINVAHESPWARDRSLVIAYPSRSWAAGIEKGLLAVVEVTGEQRVVELPGRYSVSRAAEQGERRLVVLQSASHDDGFAIAVSADSGRSWKVVKSPDSLPLSRTSQNVVTGTVDVIVQSEGHTFVHRFDKHATATFPSRIEVPKVDPYFVCRDHDVLWLASKTGSRLVRVELPSSQVVDAGVVISRIADCRTGRVLVHDDGGRQMAVCSSGACTRVTHPSSGSYGTGAIRDDGTWVYAAGNKALVAVWEEATAEPTFFRLPKAGLIVRIQRLQGLLHLLVSSADSHQLVPLPGMQATKR